MATDKTFSFTQNGTVLKVSGDLDGNGVHGLETAMNADNIFTLDFGEVQSVNFAALRALINCRKKGLRFTIINVSDSVIELFEDTGVSSFISVCRKPMPFDLSKYEEFGGGYLSKLLPKKSAQLSHHLQGHRRPAPA